MYYQTNLFKDEILCLVKFNVHFTVNEIFDLFTLNIIIKDFTIFFFSRLELDFVCR